jgi:hypothetical protein
MNTGVLGRVAVVSILISASAYAADNRSIVRLEPNLIARMAVARIVSIAPTKIQVKVPMVRCWKRRRPRTSTMGRRSGLLAPRSRRLSFSQSTKAARIMSPSATCTATSRSPTREENVPLDKINDTAKVAIVQLNAPTNKIDDFLAHAKTVADIAKTVSETYKNVQ